jgi:single-stranded DNA-binding protein
VAESLKTGARVLVTGRLQARTWETEDGQKRSLVEIEAEEVAASLRWATVAITKATKGGAQGWAPTRTRPMKRSWPQPSPTMHRPRRWWAEAKQQEHLGVPGRKLWGLPSCNAANQRDTAPALASRRAEVPKPSGTSVIRGGPTPGFHAGST